MLSELTPGFVVQSEGRPRVAGLHVAVLLQRQPTLAGNLRQLQYLKIQQNPVEKAKPINRPLVPRHAGLVLHLHALLQEPQIFIAARLQLPQETLHGPDAQAGLQERPPVRLVQVQQQRQVREWQDVIDYTQAAVRYRRAPDHIYGLAQENR